MVRQRYRRNIYVLVFIIILNLILLLFHYIQEVNAVYNIEESNDFRWQRFMNEEEFNQLKEGMTYLEVVDIAKGAGEQSDENIYVWEDEFLLTKVYEVHFSEDKLIEKKVIDLVNIENEK